MVPIFKINRIFRLIEDNTVIEYRELVTPFFYKKLKTKMYKFTQDERDYMLIPCDFSVDAVKLPEGKTKTYTQIRTIQGKMVGYKAYWRVMEFINASR